MTASWVGIVTLAVLIVWVQAWGRQSQSSLRPVQSSRQFDIQQVSAEPRVELQTSSKRSEIVPQEAAKAPTDKHGVLPTLSAFFADETLKVDEDMLSSLLAAEQYHYKPLDAYVSGWKASYRAWRAGSLFRAHASISGQDQDFNSRGELKEARHRTVGQNSPGLTGPHPVLRVAIQEHPPDMEIDRCLFGRFSPVVLSLYCSSGGRPGKVLYMPAGKRGRAAIEALRSAGLARFGVGVETAVLLTELKLPELNKLLTESGGQPARTRRGAIDAIVANERAAKLAARSVGIEDYFVLEPLPVEMSSISIARIQARCRYYRALAQLLLMDLTAERLYRDMLRQGEGEVSQAGWEVSAALDEHCCVDCREQAGTWTAEFMRRSLGLFPWLAVIQLLMFALSSVS